VVASAASRSFTSASTGTTAESWNAEKTSDPASAKTAHAK